jgi:uncharacterized protein (TIGR00255 family)
MTGAGRAETFLRSRKTKLTVEVRSANHKFLELNAKLPTILLGYENKIKELLAHKIFRGSLQMSINIQTATDEKNNNHNSSTYPRVLTLDYELLTNLLDINKELKHKYKLDGEININTIFAFPGVIIPGKNILENKNKEIWFETKKIIIKAINSLNKMKYEEGAFLYKDFIKRIATIIRSLNNIEKRSRTIRQELKKRAIPSQEQGAQLELLNASRATTEEMVRLRSHTKAFLKAIRGKKIRSVGRKLEFILSEMLRETETILAKGRDTSISRDGIAIKEEVDALREQVRNVE